MKKFKQLLALFGVFCLAAMYLITLIAAFGKSDRAQIYFRASLACTFIVPVFLYAIMLIAKLLDNRRRQPIDTVIFDVGDVLVNFPWEEYGLSLGISPQEMNLIRERVFFTDIWNEFDLGLRPYKDIVNDYCARYPEYAKSIHLILDDLYKALILAPHAESWLKELKDHGYRIYILSNWSKRNYTLLRENGTFNFLKWTDGATWSFDVHLVKPDPAIFEKLCSSWQIDPARAVFIDDNASNIEAARKFGLHAIRFKSYEEARKELAALGVR